MALIAQTARGIDQLGERGLSSKTKSEVWWNRHRNHPCHCSACFRVLLDAAAE